MPRLHSYVVEHDHGFAPNPFGGWCTLANCKPGIRAKAEVGDLIAGTGSAGAQLAGHLIYWMRVEEVTTFEQYWDDPRFRYKRPVLNGSRMQQFGDNIYSRDHAGLIRQADSFHSQEGGTLSPENLVRDTKATNRVLIGKDFTYYGRAALVVPTDLRFMVHRGQGHKNRFEPDEVAKVQAWLEALPDRGICGDPVRWRLMPAKPSRASLKN